MNTIIDIYNKILFYDKTEINYIIDVDDKIWFNIINIAKILEYKSTKDVLRDHFNKDHKRQLKNINRVNKIKKKNEQPDTVYINENGLYTLLIKSRMKRAKDFQLWLINDALPKLRQFGKYEVDQKTKKKLYNLNRKIKILTDSNKKLKSNMTLRKYPAGYHFYIIEDDSMYKIGYTKNLNKRLSVYNTGKANKVEYVYYKKTDCAKEIEECMKALLNKYIYKSSKEFYKCSLKKIINYVSKCLKIESNCSKCQDIINIKQTGGTIYPKNNIIEYILEKYKNKYTKIINSLSV